MKTFARILFFLSVVLLAVPGPVWCGDAAMVVDLSGGGAAYDSGVRAGGPVSLMDFLSEGDRIRFDGRTVLVLNYFDSGRRERISGTGTIVVGASSSRVEGGLTVRRSKLATAPPKTSAGGTPSEQAGAVTLRNLGVKKKPALKKPPAGPKVVDLETRRALYCDVCGKDEKVTVMGLFQTGVTAEKPVFRWEDRQDAGVYRVRVTDPTGRVLMDRRTQGTDLTYSGPALTAGALYRWRVDALSGGRSVAEGGGEFWRLSDSFRRKWSKEETQIKKLKNLGGTEIRICLALLHQSYGLYDRAAGLIRDLVQEHPDQKGLEDQRNLLEPRCP